MIRLFEKLRGAVRLRNPRDKYTLRNQRMTIKSTDARSRGKKKRHTIKEKGKFLGKVPITFTFNALHQLN